MKRIYFIFLLCIFSLSGYGQTITAINPAGDGGFETGTTFAANGWTLVNHTSHQWVLGTSAGLYAGSRVAYISNDGGTNNNYTPTLSQTSHFYRDVTIPAGANTITLSWYLKGTGETGWDRLLVYTAPTSITPTAGTPASSSTVLTGATLVYSQSTYYSSYTLQTLTLPNTLAGTTVRLIFTWQNDASGGTNPAAAVDNISLTYNIPSPSINATPGSLLFGVIAPSSCSTVQTFTVSGVNLTGVPGNITVTAPANYQVSPDGGATWVTSYNIPYMSTALAATTCMARFCPTGIGTYCGGNITISGGGATTANITTCGTGAAACTGTPTAGTPNMTPTNGSGATVFALNLTGSTVASGLNYQWQSSPTGAGGTFTNITGATTVPYSFTGISATTYYQCIVTCPTFASATSSTVSATYVLPTYCTPTYSTTCTGLPMPCSIASLTGVSSSISDPSTSCGNSGDNYTDRYPTMSVTLTRGDTYTANIGGNIYGSNYAVQIWIDFNNDGVFSSPSETIGGGITASTASSGANPMTLAIPATAALGEHRMRIVGNYFSCCGGTNYPTITSCPTTAITFGETRDYRVLIQPSCAPPVSGTFSVCAGSNTTLTSTTTGGTWSSSNTAVGSISSSGVVTGIASGTTIITYVTSSSCYALVIVTVNPYAGVIAGPSVLCSGKVVFLSNVVSGGTWTSSATGVATVSASGIVVAIAAGTTTISYTVATSCGSTVATYIITVNTTPALSGASSICQGTSTTFTSSVTGGTWSSSNNAVGTINSSSGVVTGISASTTRITYTAPTGCYSSNILTVNPYPVSGTITGTTTVCAGNTTTLANATTGGTWNSVPTSIATVGSTGIVTGVSPGTATISYTVSNACGTASSSIVITVNAIPGITGSLGVCMASTTTLTGSPASGVWTSSNTAVATIGSSSGLVTGSTVGTASIIYSLSGCTTNVIVTVVPTAIAGTITGTAMTCVSVTTTLSNAISGGTWSSAAVGIASVGSSGIVTGISSGTAIISYTVTNSCGTAVTTRVVTVSSTTPSAGTIYPDYLCAYTAIYISGTVSGGIWSSATPGIAIIGSTDGHLNGVSAGIATISYSVTNGCGTAVATTTVTVNASPTPITGTMATYIGGSTTLNAGGIGTWTSSNTAKATVGSGTGIVTGVGTGTAIISCTFGSCTTTAVVTVTSPGAYCTPSYITSCTSLAMPCSIGNLTGISSSINDPSTTCGGTGPNYQNKFSTMSVTLAQSGAYTANIGGNSYWGNYAVQIWVDFNDDGIFSSPSETIGGGLVTSSATYGANPMTLSIPASAAIGTHRMRIVGNYMGCCGGYNYPSIPSCPTSPVTYGETRDYKAVIQAGCIAPLTGTNTVCIGGITTLSSTTSGGTWSSSNTAVGTVSTSGVVTGISSGTTTISYVISGSCFTSVVVTVNTTASAGSITGASSLCIGNNLTLSNPTSGGTWGSGSTSIATVNSSGVVTGVTSGVALISYTVSSSCGTAVATKSLTVNASAAPITGTALVCVGATTTLGNAVAGGTWTSSASGIATINATTGLVTGMSLGTTNITYSIGGCYSTLQVTVNTTLSGSIAGSTNVCVGNTTTFTFPTTGGVWTSSNTSLATINTTTGVITGVAPGITTITYAVGSCYKTKNITVNAAGSGTITGNTNVCVGSTTVLSYPTSGTSWTSSNPAVATIGITSGVVMGISAGTTLISYLETTGCGSNTVVSVFALPTPITGTFVFCQGATSGLSSAGTPGGTWTSSNTSKSSVAPSTGVVTGVGGGTATISYAWTNSCLRTAQVTVNPLPVAGAIVGAGIVHVGSSTTLSPSSVGGTWASASPAIATVTPGSSSTCILTGISAGSVVISYTNTNGCGSATVTRIFSIVFPKPGVQETGAGGSLFNVYPNPTSGEVTVETSVSGLFNVYSIDGRLVQQYEIKELTTNITLSNMLTAGVYMCRFNGDDGSTVMVRLVVER